MALLPWKEAEGPFFLFLLVVCVHSGTFGLALVVFLFGMFCYEQCCNGKMFAWR